VREVVAVDLKTDRKCGSNPIRMTVLGHDFAKQVRANAESVSWRCFEHFRSMSIFGNLDFWVLKFGGSRKWVLKDKPSQLFRMPQSPTRLGTRSYGNEV
jgi:hypothetical protein